jgi:hypothetical protein
MSAAPTKAQILAELGLQIGDALHLATAADLQPFVRLLRMAKSELSRLRQRPEFKDKSWRSVTSGWRAVNVPPQFEITVKVRRPAFGKRSHEMLMENPPGAVYGQSISALAPCERRRRRIAHRYAPPVGCLNVRIVSVPHHSHR